MPPDSGPAHDWRDANRKTFPMNFADLGVPASLIKILEKQGITTPTPIQAATLPDSIVGAALPELRFPADLTFEHPTGRMDVRVELDEEAGGQPVVFVTRTCRRLFEGAALVRRKN